jgi:putative tricarboxylic transport membrane protein
MFDVWIALGGGVLGYVMRKNNWPQAPLLVGFILGDMVEFSLRQSISMGGPLIFFNRPITVVFLLSAVILVIVSVKFFKRIPKEMMGEKSD